MKGRRGFVLMEGLIIITFLMLILLAFFQLGKHLGGFGLIFCVPAVLFFGLVGIILLIEFVMWCYFAYKQFMWKRGWGPPPPGHFKTWL